MMCISHPRLENIVINLKMKLGRAGIHHYRFKGPVLAKGVFNKRVNTLGRRLDEMNDRIKRLEWTLMETKDNSKYLVDEMNAAKTKKHPSTNDDNPLVYSVMSAPVAAFLAWCLVCGVEYLGGGRRF
jgi:hypothetical protein